MSFIKRITPIIIITALMAFASCNKADEYFEVLQNEPEIIFGSIGKAYGVGDTLVLEGRFNYGKNELQVTIGNVPATIINADKDGFDFERLKVIVTKEMGIGVNRPITIRSNNVTIQAPAIEIVGDINTSVLPGQLELIRLTDIPNGSQPVYCLNGKGNIYLWNANKRLTVVNADGATSAVFDESYCLDARGPFTIETFEGGGIDANETYFWFSAIVKEPTMPPLEAALNDVYKLCRYNIARKELTVVNRSLYPKQMSQRTMASITPFEGDVANAKIFRLTGVYPDTRGNVYFNVDNGNFITHLNSSGQYTYVLDLAPNLDRGQMIPQIKRPDANASYTTDRMHSILPGANVIEAYNITALDPEDGHLYTAGSNSSVTLVQYGLGSQAELHRFGYPPGSSIPFDRYYLTASFASLTIPFSGGFQNGLALPGKKLLRFISTGQSPAQQAQYALPAWCQLDFESKTGTRYARGIFDLNGYTLNGIDVPLNYDADGMIYLTANSKSVIVKTRYK